jgi:hypothetical protein
MWHCCREFEFIQWVGQGEERRKPRSRPAKPRLPKLAAESSRSQLVADLFHNDPASVIEKQHKAAVIESVLQHRAASGHYRRRRVMPRHPAKAASKPTDGSGT